MQVARRKRSILRKAERAAAGGVAIPETAGESLSGGIRSQMEQHLGADLSAVKVHTGQESASAASALGARAFTDGNDVHFAAGQFSPGSKEGDRLLAHELTHVVQGQRSDIQRKAAPGAGGGAQAQGGEVAVSEPHEPAEMEADHVADQVAGRVHGGGSGAAVQIGATITGVGRKIFRDTHSHHQHRRGDGHAADDAAPALERGRSAPGPDEDEFARAFNTEFASVLHAFGDPVTRDQRARAHVEDNRFVEQSESGPRLTGERCRQLFSENQRRLLLQFHNDHMIPDHLFSGDDPGGPNPPNAQQRILLSGHILARGQYQPGSFSQRLHARMCGHWVNLVNSYAGAADASGAGIREQFDAEGGLAMGTRSRPNAVYGGDVIEQMEDADEPSGFSENEQRGLPWSRFGEIQAGDWIYVFNDNGGGFGNHSVIFSRWSGPARQFHDPPAHTSQGVVHTVVNYRPAVIQGQGTPEHGGRQQIFNLADRFRADQRLYPVTRLEHVARDAQPVRSVDDLRQSLGETQQPDARPQRHRRHAPPNPLDALPHDSALRRQLGTGPDAAANLRTLQAHQGNGQVNMQALFDDIRARNRSLIDELAARHGQHPIPPAPDEEGNPQPHTADQRMMTDGQLRTFNQANGTDDLSLLIRLNQRLRIWVRNAQTLDAGQAAQAEGVESSHALHQQLDQLPDDREHRGERRQLQTQINQLNQSPYYLAQARRRGSEADQDRFQGRGERGRVDGLLESLDPQPNWGRIVVQGDESGGEPPSGGD